MACDEDSKCTPAGEKLLTIALGGSDIGRTLSPRHYYMYTRSGTSTPRIFTGGHWNSAKTMKVYGDIDNEAGRYVVALERITDVSSPESYELATECVQKCVRTP